MSPVSVIPAVCWPEVGALSSGNPEWFFKELDSGLRPAGMTALTAIFGSMTSFTRDAEAKDYA